MTPKCHRRALMLAALAGLVACTTTYRAPLDATLFPTTTAAAALDKADVALSLEDPEQVFQGPELRHFSARVDMPLARIVEAAGVRALRSEFAAVGVGPSGADPATLRLQVAGIAMDLKSERIYFIPLPYIWPQRVDVTLRLRFTVRVLGPEGMVRWAQDYDSGAELWVPRRKQFLVPEPVQEGVQRVAHELSLRLMQQAARDARAWVEHDRRRERVL